jgi:putative membrane protein
MFLLEYHLVRPLLSSAELIRLANVDLLYWSSGMMTLITGVLLTFFIGKSSTFFLTNSLYQIKITLFALAVIATIYPTYYFQSHRRRVGNSRLSIPRSIVMIMRIKLPVLFLLPLLATLMSNGYSL